MKVRSKGREPQKVPVTVLVIALLTNQISMSDSPLFDSLTGAAHTYIKPVHIRH
jgi:hypothetical protein